MALGRLSLQTLINIAWQCANTLTGFPSGPGDSNNVNKTLTYGTGTANTAIVNNISGGDTLYATTLTISASGTATINLQNFTDVAGVASQSMARVKIWHFRLLGTGELSPDGTIAGNGCSGITIGAGSTPFGFNFGAASNTNLVENSDVWEQAKGTANGKSVSGSNNNILITNNDSANPAQVVVVIGGATS
jgi:hypothetical protein